MTSGSSSANAAAGALVMAHQGTSYSQQQAFRDNIKMQAVYRKSCIMIRNGDGEHEAIFLLFDPCTHLFFRGSAAG
jgi:hypothetical protein